MPKGLLLIGLGVIIFFLVILTSNGQSVGKEIKIAGGAAPMNNIFKPMKEEIEGKTGISLNLLELGPKIAMQELLRGRVDLACAGLSWESWVELMKREEGLDIKRENFEITEVGKDLIKIYVNPENPIESLSKEQIKGIFTGKIKNWKEVGGKDEPITVVWGTLIPGTNKVFTEEILDGEEVTAEAFIVGDISDIREAIANLPEAIGIGPISLMYDKNLKVVKSPEVGRPIICVYPKGSNSLIQKLLDLIKVHRSSKQ